MKTDQLAYVKRVFAEAGVGNGTREQKLDALVERARKDGVGESKIQDFLKAYEAATGNDP